MKRNIHFVLLATAIALFWPTRLDLLFQGMPITHKADLFILFVFILLTLLSLLNWFRDYTSPFLQRRATKYISLIVLVLSLITLGVKSLYPLSAGISVCTRSPYMGDQCLTSTEKHVKAVAWGEGFTPWRLLFLNTLNFNFSNCKNDLTCSLHEKWRQEKKEPFEIEVNLKTSKATIQYIGSLQVESGAWTIFSNEKREISLTSESSVRYRSFSCDEKWIAQCKNHPELSPLDTDHAFFRIIESAPQNTLVLPLNAVQVMLVLFLVLYTGIVLCSDCFVAKSVVVERNWLLATNIAIFVCFLLFVPPGERGQPLVYLFFIAWVSLWNEYLSKYIGLFVPISLCGWFLYSFYSLPLFDTQTFYHPGWDELTYASMGYDLLSSPGYFFNPDLSFMPFMVLSKPFFVQMRAFFQWLLGDGTTYFVATAQYFTGLLPFIFCLAVRPIIRDHISTKKYFSVVLVFFSSFTVFFLQSIFFNYVTKRDPSSSEVTAWVSGILALIYLYPILQNKREDKTFYWAFIWGLCAFSICMRTFNLCVFLLMPVFLLSDIEWRKKRFLKSFILVFVCAFLFILYHASPVLYGHLDSFNSYLGWQFNGWSNEKPSIWWGYDRVFFHVYFKSVLLLVIFLCWLRSHSGGKFFRKRFIVFVVALVAVVFAHAKITEPAGYPRHLIFFYICICHLILMAALINPPIKRLQSVFRFFEKS